MDYWGPGKQFKSIYPEGPQTQEALPHDSGFCFFSHGLKENVRFNPHTRFPSLKGLDSSAYKK